MIATSSVLKTSLEELQIQDGEVSEEVVEEAMSVNGVTTTLHDDEKESKEYEKKES